jgi:hypothetical protein
MPGPTCWRTTTLTIQAAGIPGPEVQRLHLEKYTALLYEISQVLGYEFGKTEIRDNAYRPMFHNDVEEDVN